MAEIEDVVERAVFGTWQIGTRRWGWVRSAEGIGAKAGRALIGAGLLYAGGALGLHWPWVGAGEISTLIAWGYAKADTTTAAAAAEEEDVELSPEEIVLTMVLDLIGDAPGIHLDTLLTELRKAQAWAGMERDDLRTLLAAAGCPVRRALRVGPRTGVAGVHRDDARTALDTLAEDDTPLPPPGTAPDL